MKYTKKELKEMLFTEEEIKRVIDEEYGLVERINKRYSSINEFNKQQKDTNAEIIKDGERYKLVSVSDGDVKEIFDTKEDIEKFLEKEKAFEIMMTNSIRRMLTDDYYIARKSILNYNLQKASDEIVKEFTRLVEINNRVNQEEEAIWVGNYIYLNMGDNYIKMNIHNLEKTTVKEVDYSDFVITKDIKFYSYDNNGELKRVNKSMTELTETEEIDIYEKDKNGNNKTERKKNKWNINLQ